MQDGRDHGGGGDDAVPLPGEVPSSVKRRRSAEAQHTGHTMDPLDTVPPGDEAGRQRRYRRRLDLDDVGGEISTCRLERLGVGHAWERRGEGGGGGTLGGLGMS